MSDSGTRRLRIVQRLKADGAVETVRMEQLHIGDRIRIDDFPDTTWEVLSEPLVGSDGIWTVTAHGEVDWTVSGDLTRV